jgi:hypothetical protein
MRNGLLRNEDLYARRQIHPWVSTSAGGLAGEMFLGFLKRLMRRRKEPLHRAPDNLSAHNDGGGQGVCFLRKRQIDAALPAGLRA